MSDNIPIITARFEELASGELPVRLWKDSAGSVIVAPDAESAPYSIISGEQLEPVNEKVSTIAVEDQARMVPFGQCRNCNAHIHGTLDLASSLFAANIEDIHCPSCGNHTPLDIAADRYLELVMQDEAEMEEDEIQLNNDDAEANDSNDEDAEVDSEETQDEEFPEGDTEDEVDSNDSVEEDGEGDDEVSEGQDEDNFDEEASLAEALSLLDEAEAEIEESISEEVESEPEDNVDEALGNDTVADSEQDREGLPTSEEEADSDELAPAVTDEEIVISADAAGINDKELELVLSSDKSRYFLFADNVPVAQLVKDEIETASLKEIFEDNAFGKAFFNAVSSNEDITQYGYVPYNLTATVDQATAAKLKSFKDEARAQVEAENTHRYERLLESLDVAALAQVKGVWDDFSNPVRNDLVRILDLAGVEGAATLVDSVFAKSGAEFTRTLVSKAKELMSMDTSAFNAVKTMIDTAKFQTTVSQAEDLASRLAANSIRLTATSPEAAEESEMTNKSVTVPTQRDTASSEKKTRSLEEIRALFRR